MPKSATAKVVRLKTPAPSFMDAMKATAKPKKAAAKKSTIKTLEADEKVKDSVDALVKAKATEKKAKADISLHGGIVIGFTQDHQDTDGFKNKFQNSYLIPGNDDNQIKCISSNRFTINSEDAGALQELLGDEYDEMVKTKYGMTMTEEFMESEELQKELMEMVGERFSQFFKTTVSLSVKEKFNEKIYKILSAEDLPALRTFAKQYKPSLR
jgi:hypothetical protein